MKRGAGIEYQQLKHVRWYSLLGLIFLAISGFHHGKVERDCAAQMVSPCRVDVAMSVDLSQVCRLNT